MKKIAYILLPSLILCGLVAVGYGVGRYVAGERFNKVISWVEKGENLATVLAVTPLNDEQRNNYAKAYTAASVDAGAISWSVPNQPTPFVGTAPVPGQHLNAYINSWQMRNKQELQMPKQKGAYRIFLTGGSTAYGSGAPSQESTIGSLLEKRLNDELSKKNNLHYEVFTFANPAWASTQERIAIENYLSELQPDLILSLSGNNDVFWGDAGRNVLWFSAFADDYFRTLANEGLLMAGRKELADLPHAKPVEGPVPSETVAYRLEKNTRLGAHALENMGVQWIFFLQPTLSVTKKPLTPRERDFLSKSKAYYEECYQAIVKRLSVVDARNFKFVNLAGVFDQYGSAEDMFLDQFHFGDKGNAVIANAMFTTLLPRLGSTPQAD